MIPGINFRCNGIITRWIVGAEWEGNDEAFTELQIWRGNSTNQYVKINGTSLMVGAENDSRVYEYLLDTPLAFQEGDNLGYFQPRKSKSELDLYLEKSGRITTYHTKHNNDFVPPLAGTVFDIGNSMIDTRYPLIAVRTGATQTWFVVIMILFYNLRSSRLWVRFHVRGESVCTARYTTTQLRNKKRIPRQPAAVISRYLVYLSWRSHEVDHSREMEW